MKNSSVSEIYRCSIFNEPSFLDRRDQALILKEEMDIIPDGFGLYLYEKDLANLISKMDNAHPIPKNCEAGSFVMVERDGTLKLLSSSDRPDRSIYVTGLCNSNCIMCPYTEKYRRESSLETLSLLKREIDLMNPDADYVCITGGEPTLLGSDFIELVRHVRDHFESPILHILTNGRTFCYRDFVREYLNARPYKTLLGIPLHGDNPELHDYISQAMGSFSQTLKALDLLYSVGERIELRIVTSGLNYKGLVDTAKMIVQRYPCCQHVCMMGLEMMGNAMIHRKDVWRNYDMIWPYIREAVYTLVMNGVEVKLYNYPLCIVDEELRPLYKKSITPSKIEYLNECEKCRKKMECGGFFKTTKAMRDIVVRPFLEEEI